MIRIIVFCIVILKCEALIVPQELPSLLSLVYSTIPQIKKGTDSRFGFGFRLGEHADLQLMLELGPQTQTRPIGSDTESSGSTNKRHININEYKKLSIETKKEPNLWLQNWSNDMTQKIKKSNLKQNPPLEKTNQNPTFISAQALKELQTLYKINENKESNLKVSIT